jgi:hypothetical protein
MDYADLVDKDDIYDNLL